MLRELQIMTFSERRTITEALGKPTKAVSPLQDGQMRLRGSASRKRSVSEIWESKVKNSFS